MKKIFLIVAMIFVTIMANAHVFLFQLKHEKLGNTNLIIDTDKQTIKWMAGIEEIVNIKYSKACSDNPNANNRNMSDYEKLANMQFFFYSSNLPTPKSIKASLEDIVKGKYGEGCIITIKGVILVLKNEGKFLFVDLDRRDQNEYVETFADFMVKISGINTSSNSPGTSSSTRPTGNCPDGNHPHLIDLGLPSGTKWACCNVGANKPESSGEYYSWGEVATKYRYNYKTYLHYSNGRYINIGTDISGSRYDAAHVEWGGNWRMPTYNEAKELINNCTYEWTVLNGVKGGKFTSKINGKSIFLPASGLRGDSGLEEQGVYGYCWSGTLNSNDDTHAYYLGCNSTNAFCNYWIRPCGHPVRPVRKN